MDKTLHVIDYIIIVIPLIVIIGIGFYFSKRQKSTSTYFTADKSIPTWAVSMSLLATLISSITFLAYPGEGFKSNWLLLVQAFMVVIVVSGLLWFIVPFYRKVINVSIYEFFEKRFGSIVRVYGSFGFILASFAAMGTVFYLLAIALSSMIGLNPLTIIWVVGSSIILITVLGGIEGVVWLDVVQGFLLIIGGIISLFYLLFIPPEGPMAIIDTALSFDKISFGPYKWDFTHLTFFVLMFNGIFYGIQKYTTDQTIVQRYLTARSDKKAIKGALYGLLGSLLIWVLFMFIGTSLFSFYKITDNILPAGINPDAVFPYFILTQLPTGVKGLVISALIAAAISTIASILNSMSAIIVKDYYKKIYKNCTDKQQLRIGKLSVLIAGLISLVISTLFIIFATEGILEVIFELYAIFSGGIAGIFLLGVFSKRANNQGMLIALAICILFTAYAVLTSTKIDNKPLLDLGMSNFNQSKYMIGVYSHLIIIIFGYIASLFFERKEVDKDLTIYAWYEKSFKKNYQKL